MLCPSISWARAQIILAHCWIVWLMQRKRHNKIVVMHIPGHVSQPPSPSIHTESGEHSTLISKDQNKVAIMVSRQRSGEPDLSAGPCCPFLWNPPFSEGPSDANGGGFQSITAASSLQSQVWQNAGFLPQQPKALSSLQELQEVVTGPWAPTAAGTRGPVTTRNDHKDSAYLIHLECPLEGQAWLREELGKLEMRLCGETE